MKKLLIGLLVLAACVVGGAYYWNSQAKAVPLPPRFGEVVQGNVDEKVSATARVLFVDAVNVSSDVPYARVAEILPIAEIGKSVKKGDQLIKLDDQLAQAKLDEALAAVSAAEASKLQAEAKRKSADAFLGQAQAKLQLAITNKKMVFDNPNLTAQGVRDEAASKVSEADEGVKFAESQIKEADSAIQAAAANIKKANAGVTYARENLKMLVINSPIDGTIIDKKVTSAGQVISPQTHPVLFVIVPEIDKFELEAQVGEADIAKVRKGMEATFRVDAYSEDDTTFAGRVTQIAFVPTITVGRLTEGSSSGPVVYKVTLEVLPYKGAEPRPLKPGLTANVDLLVKRVTNVLHVPNQALSYQPDNLPEQERAEIEKRRAAGWKPIWTWNNGVSQRLFIQTGANDGSRTEVLKVEDGQQLQPKTQVIVEGPPKPEAGGLFGGGKTFKLL